MKRIVKIQFAIFVVVLFYATYYVSVNVMVGSLIERERLMEIPEIKRLLEDNPEAQVNETYINETESASVVQVILEKCGKDVEIGDYVLVEIESDGSMVNAYFDPTTKEAICVYVPDQPGGGAGGGGAGDDGEDGGAGGGGGGGPGGGDGGGPVSCTSGADCDDGNPYTTDSCPSGFCENTLKTCSGIGGIICSGVQTCSSSSVPASDGTCCLGQCETIGGDECQTDADCDDSDYSTTDTCEGSPKVCVNMLKTCAQMGHQQCSPGQSCTTSFVPASDTDRCCGDQCYTPIVDLCDTDDDCTTTNPTLDGRCDVGDGGYKRCFWDYIPGVCAPGDDHCPVGCTTQNDSTYDPDCA